MILHALTAYAIGHDQTLNVTEILGAFGLSALRAGVASGPETPSTPVIAPVLLAFGLFAAAPLQAQEWTPAPIGNGNTWSWEAPSTALPDTEWYDYGWDSTSNGPAPIVASSGFRVPGSELHRERSPLRRVQHAPATQPGTRNVEPGTAPQELTGSQTEHYGRLYFDSFLSAHTPDFNQASYGYGLGVGYQASKYWSVEGRLGHHGLDFKGSAIQSLGPRLVARMPFDFLSPYTFLGATFDLERDDWRLQPGGGIELGVSEKLHGLSIFAEGGLDADLKGRNGYLFTGGVRIRF